MDTEKFFVIKQSQTDIAIFLLFFLNTFLIAFPENKQLCDLLLSWTLQLKTYLHSVSEGGSVSDGGGEHWWMSRSSRNSKLAEYVSFKGLLSQISV